MENEIIPDAALNYIKDKKLKVGFSYKDVWNEEHATAFTVAKAMQIDVLSDIKSAVETAIKDGHSFEHFKKDLQPTLIKKGWWGRKTMTDPLTGEEIDAQLGSDRRLKTIYDTNLRSAFQKAQYDRTMASDLHPYLMYRVGNSARHREQHLAWDGLILPKDDPFWDKHLPPNEYGCKCYTRAISEPRKQRYERDGIRVPPKADGSGAGVIRVKTKAPAEEYTTYFNERKGLIERLPKGVAPGFNWHLGKAGRDFSVLQAIVPKLKGVSDKDNKAFLQSILSNQIYKAQFANFVANAFSGQHKGKEITPVGFFDRNICRWLKKNQKIDVGENTIIGLETRLIKGIKATRHGIRQEDAEIILEAMLYGKTYWYCDPHENKKKDALIYLYPVNEDEWIRLVVRPIQNVNGITAPFIRSVGYLSNKDVENLLKQMTEIKGAY